MTDNPEMRLVAAVLWQGCYDAVNPDYRDKRGSDDVHLLGKAEQASRDKWRAIAIAKGDSGADALGWVMSDDWHAYSFNWCCSILDLPAKKLRDHILYHPAETFRDLRKQAPDLNRPSHRRPRGSF
jgi:hypothetical protein